MIGLSWRNVTAGIVMACVLASIVDAAAAEQAGVTTYKVTVIREPAGIRNEGGERILDLQKGDILVVLQEAEGNTYKVQTIEYDQTVGYINRDLVKEEAETFAAKKESVVSATSEPPEKSWFGRNWGWVAGGAALLAGGGIGLAAAGGSGGDGGEDGATTADTGGTTSTSTSTGGGGSSDNDEGLAGTWRGRAGSYNTSTTLRLSQNGSSLSGTCSWYGKTLSCSGSVSGSQVSLSIASPEPGEDADRWDLTYSGSTLNGTGYKPSGGSYSVRLSK